MHRDWHNQQEANNVNIIKNRIKAVRPDEILNDKNQTEDAPNSNSESYSNSVEGDKDSENENDQEENSKKTFKVKSNNKNRLNNISNKYE